jgi:serine/threonine protein kinase
VVLEGGKEEAMTNQFPEKFGKYKIVEEVGRGGFADVYRAIDTTLDRTVALKFLEPRLLREPTFVERFQYEAKLAANLNEFGWEAGTVYFAMEFLEGRTLKEVILDEGALPSQRIVNLVGQIASALDYAHGRGLVHRDIKPSNIMVGADDHVTVMDFGIAKAAALTALTTTGRIFGTPQYMSPEQAEGLEEPDARSDIYSLGVVVYEMIAGEVPFTGTTPLSIMRGHADKPPPRPSEINPDVPPAVEAVLLKALAKKREERYQSAGAMATALQQGVSEAVVKEVKAPPEPEKPVPTPVPPPPVTTPPPRPKRRPFTEIPGLWLKVTHMTEAFFAQEAPRASGPNTLISISIYTVIAVILTALSTLVGDLLSEVLSEVLGTADALTMPTYAAITPLTWSSVCLALGGTLLTFYVYQGLTYLGARLLGGTGNFVTQAYLMSLFVVPLGVVTGLVNLVPYVGCLVWFPIGLYMIVLGVRATKIVHQLGRGPALIVVAFPFLLAICLILIAVVLFAAVLLSTAA